MERHFQTASEAETQALAANIAGIAPYPTCITLMGDLGAGKTTFARAFIRALAGNVTVQSPTFMLVIPYAYEHQGSPATLQHFDLYRLKDAAELTEIGFDDALQHSLCLIEWPEIAVNHLPEHRLDIIISHLNENLRGFHLIAKGDWQDVLNNI